MIGSPLIARADAPPPAKNAPVDKTSEPPSDKAPPGNKPVDKAPAEKVPPSKDPAGPGSGSSGSRMPAPKKANKPTEKKDPKPTPRPRAQGDRPIGRGFVLA